MQNPKYKVTLQNTFLVKKERLQSSQYKILSLPYRASAESKIQNTFPFLVIQGEGRVQNDGGQQDVEEEGGGELGEGMLGLIP
jgi:hypothetical protein